MLDVMKIGYVAALIISVAVFNSCTDGFIKKPQQNLATYYSVPRMNTAYGSYLAGRVAHLRQDLNTAADYYMQSIALGADKPEIVSQTYILLTSEGRIHEAAKYAQIASKDGDDSNFIKFVIMADAMQNNDFEKALKALQPINDKVYKSSIIPLFSAWIYTGLNDKKQALKQLEVLKNDESLLSLYYMHTGMINDYFNDTENAQKAFDTVVNNQNLELSYRSLQIISNFYLRNGQQQQAQDLIKSYYEKNQQAKMLENLYLQIKNADPQSVKKLIDTPQKGEAEAIFNIGTVFRLYQTDISQVFTALALYLNPQHEVALVSMADLMEGNQRFDDAIEKYQNISKESPVYFMAQLKIASIYLTQGQNKKALEQLQKLEKEFPDNYQVLFNLGEVSRMMNKQSDAIDFYNKALKVMPKAAQNDWTVYYALGMAYERNGQWKKAEEALQKALKISNRHPFVLNYLGYTWLEQNKNFNEALFMIFEAYSENPEDGHIMDSLGWALYRMGKYEDAVKILERASEYLPGNALLCDHLGDAYWQVGRKAEAKFQWQHALTLKEDSQGLDKDAIADKIESGVTPPPIINFNEPLLVERLQTLNINNQ